MTLLEEAESLILHQILTVTKTQRLSPLLGKAISRCIG